VRPDGTLVVVVTVFSAFGTLGSDELVSLVSTDGGESFAAPAVVARTVSGEFFGVRAPLLVSGDTDSVGVVYVAWADCRFREECSGSDIVVARSTDGSTWQAPRRVPAGRGGPNVEHFVPGLAIRPGTSGNGAELAVVYHSFPQQSGCVLEQCPGIDVWLATSPDGGRNWRPRRRLNAESMPLGWIANTGTGRMVADYVSVSWSGGRPVAVYSLATRAGRRGLPAGDLRRRPRLNYGPLSAPATGGPARSFRPSQSSWSTYASWFSAWPAWYQRTSVPFGAAAAIASSAARGTTSSERPSWSRSVFGRARRIVVSGSTAPSTRRTCGRRPAGARAA
jgi:hypothetical protein